MPLPDVRYRDQRDYIRMEIDTEVQCVLYENMEEFKARCRNISHSGIKLETGRYIPEGTELQVVVHGFGNTIKPLRANLYVNRVTRVDNELFYVSGKLRDIQ